jgi:uncharacterized protein DUF4418
MKVMGVLIMALAVLIAVVPIFYNCQHDGKAATLANGMKVPMKCFWTAMAAIASAAPLLGVGGLLAFSRQRETRRSLGLLGVILGVVVIGLPTFLIGVCAHPDASCHLVMKPALIFMGALVVGLSLTTLALPGSRQEQRA